MKILIAEDEPKLNRGLVEGLTQRGYVVDAVFDGVRAEEKAAAGGYDVIVLDIMMPERDGVTVCNNLRQRNVHTPILFLTARDAIVDRVLGLDMGGDDYLIKPFSFEELTARLRSLARRPQTLRNEILTFDECTLDPRAMKATVRGVTLDLTGKEFALLEYFMRNPGVVTTREEITTHVWDQFHDAHSNIVDVHVKNLRKKLPKPYAKRLQTVWGKGYRLV